MTIQVEINDRSYRCSEDRTILQVCNNEGIFLPTMCHIPGKEKRSVCRICSVETNTSPNLMTACSTPVRDGMKIYTHSSKVVQAQKILMELILQEHGSCNNPHCEVEALAETLGISVPTGGESEDVGYSATTAVKSVSNSDYIQVNREKCIHCDRCIRTCEKAIISRAKFDGALSMSFENRYDFHNDHCTLCGDCEKICPAGVYELISIGA